MRRDTGAQRSIGKVPRTRSVGKTIRALGLAATLVAPVAGCTQMQTTGQSAAYLIVDSIAGASGAEPDQFTGTLASDVVTNVKVTLGTETVFVPTIYEDSGQVTFRLALKDPGSADSPSRPSSSNFITVTRYRVEYIRADGRNSPGVDVPYPFDGGMTATVTDSGATATFSLVRVQAKEEAPLQQLVNAGGANAISTIAEITFFGTDQAGRTVSVTGRIGVNFADWGDPQ